MEQSEFTNYKLKRVNDANRSEEEHEISLINLFECNFCNKTYNKIDELKYDIEGHLQTLSTVFKRQFNTNLFDCINCGGSFETEHSLKSHMTSAHSVYAKPYSCDKCDRKFTRTDDLNIHMRHHKGLETFDCAICDRVFAQQKSLAGHNEKFHSNDALHNMTCQSVEPTKSIGTANCIEYIRKFKCPLCQLVFVKMNTLKIHCKRNHAGEYQPIQLDDIENRSGTLTSSDGEVAQLISRPQICFVCNASHGNKQELWTHLNREHNSDKPYKCSKCGVNFARHATLEQHVNTHSKSSEYTCKYCGLRFKTIYSLSKHTKRHEGLITIKCNVCDIPYTNQKYLDKHLRSHSGGKPHQCLYCEKRFAHSCDRAKHMRIHTGERPYQCQKCPKSFAHLTSLRKHEIIHSGERLFQCTVCGKSFQHKSNLIVHHRSHSGERPFLCRLCDKSFMAAGHYTRHMKMHRGDKDYECTVCSKQFLHHSSFQKHRRMHNGDKPHKCLVCDRTFSQPGHLREHTRIHTGEKPFSCTLCTKSFRRLDTLKLHILRHKKSKSRKMQISNQDKSQVGGIMSKEANINKSVVNDSENIIINRVEI